MREPDSLWQALFLKFKADGIVPWVGNVRQASRHSEDEKNSDVGFERNARNAILHFVQRGPADGRALRHQGNRNAPAPPRVPDIVP